MRKLLSGLLVVCILMVSIGTALAVDFDFSSYTDDEIVELLAQIQDEIVNRHIEKTATLPQGTYFTGKDIPAGSYVFISLASEDQWGNITIRSEHGKGEQKFWNIATADKEAIYYITLEEDDELKSDVPFSLTISAGAMFK